VRLERAQDRWFSGAATVLLVIAGGGLGALLRGPTGAALGALTGLAGGAALGRRLGGRARRRRAAIALPFPERWREFLLERYDHYERLPPELRRRFEDDLRLFLLEKRITGVGIDASEELRLLVAASAVTLSLGWTDEDWDRLTEVLLYPDDFDRDYAFGGSDLAGETHAWGTVILSAPTLEESFEYDSDGYHVGLHEFAHLLELQQAQFAGTPAGLEGEAARAWADLVPKEMERLRHGKSVLDEYGAGDPVEFFAVAVEAFFERPQELRRRHRELYEILASWFRQDPAAWDDARARKE
jgi:hypothetical protein